MLVVTIVILLILAGITIAPLFGNNGVIKKAKGNEPKEDIQKTKYLKQMNIIMDGEY